jgi:hypothetical protein
VILVPGVEGMGIAVSVAVMIGGFPHAEIKIQTIDKTKKTRDDFIFFLIKQANNFTICR